jgi:hypothetical protein
MSSKVTYDVDMRLRIEEGGEWLREKQHQRERDKKFERELETNANYG